MEIEDLEGVVALPGARELLSSLPPDRWTIVTSCTRPLAEVRLKAAGLAQPPKMVTWNDIVHGKPAPDPYLKGAEKLGMRPEDCIVVEDVPAGIHSGKSAGARVVAFKTTVDADALREAGADWITANCSALRARLDGAQLSLTIRD
jgi:sugar-phosphatase